MGDIKAEAPSHLMCWVFKTYLQKNRVGEYLKNKNEDPHLGELANKLWVI